MDAIDEYKDYGFGKPQVFGDPVVHAIFNKDNHELHLSGGGKPGGSSLWLIVQDLTETKELILKNRPHVEYEELENPPSGFREFSIEDASGNILTFRRS